MINYIPELKEEINEILEDYKVYFSNTWEKEEKYKWVAVKHFQDNWNIEASDFAAMFEKATAQTKNLLSSSYFYPRKAMIEYAKADNEKVRSMFIKLFDESVDLIERIKDFETKSNEIFQIIRKESDKNHYQTLNAISTYLWLRYPDKYTIYKSTLLDSVFMQLCGHKCDIKNKYDKMSASFEIYNKIGAFAKQRQDIIEMFNKACSPDCYNDSELKTLSIDIVYFISKVYYQDDAEWYPDDKTYNPDISKSDWLDLLHDTKFMKKSWYDFFAGFYQYPEGASCSQIADEYGTTVMSLNGTSVAIGKAVHSKLNCPLWTKNENTKYFTIMFLCRETDDEEQGSFVWKLREELYEALTEFDIIHYTAKEVESDLNISYPKNMILYGPPGTGKTYNTVNYAVAIVENKDFKSVLHENYTEVLERYNRYKSERLIEFVTFHQSYGYEEFIEGIKPELDSTKNGEIKYSIADGVFKKFCQENKTVSNKNTFETAWALLIKKASVTGKYIFTKTTGNQFTLDLLSDDKFRRNYGGEKNNHNDISKNEVLRQYRNEYNFDEMGSGTKEVYRMREAVLSELKASYNLIDYVESDNNPFNNHISNKVFIIDEINRGNISKILGELITLVEPTKRLGRPEALKSVLPYSGDEFGVPDNIYIIGTMNTADRSIALMDTALRRRFQFIEMMPDSSILDNLGIGTIEADNESISVSVMLNVINRRIEVLYDREHMIGHAVFTPLKDNPSLEPLSDIFRNKIIPLLQEYFYEDYSKIQLVLGDNCKSSDKFKFILNNPVENDIFNGNPDIDIQEDTYLIQESAFSLIRSYKEIGQGI